MLALLDVPEGAQRMFGIQIHTVVDPTNNKKKYSFLLRINKDRTAYEATIAPLMVLGQSHVKVSVYDYEAFVVATYQSPVLFVDESVFSDEEVVFPDVLVKQSPLVVLTAVSPSILLLLIMLARRFRGKTG